jgi:adenine-specific DNA-methyltransferase
MAKIDITRTELVWPGKYNEDGTLKEVPRVSLPFQVIETVNESRATREARKDGVQGGLFDVYEGKEGDTFEAGWRNKLIWGDNLLVMGSLLEKFAGKIDLIYIDPPFAIGADFSFTAFIGEEEVEIEKEQSLLEEKAYRDTWANGVDSYIAMLFPRLQLMRDLLSPKGNLFVHLGVNIASYLRPVLSEVFGESAFTNEIIWKRSAAHSDIGQGAVHLGRLHDVLFWYRASDDSPFHMQYEPYSEEYVASFYKHVEAKTGRRYALDNTSGPGGARKGNPYYEFRGVRKYWRYSEKRIEQLYNDGRLVQSAGGNDWRYKRYLDEMPGVPIQDLWLDIPPLQSQTVERVGYDTQKPERLLQRVMALGSSEGDLVADFFCGSGTTLAVAEKLGRRWIGCDLGRWGIHVTRKRLLGIEKCKPFEVLNLGKYERQYWQSVTFGRRRTIRSPSRRSMSTSPSSSSSTAPAGGGHGAPAWQEGKGHDPHRRGGRAGDDCRDRRGRGRVCQAQAGRAARARLGMGDGPLRPDGRGREEEGRSSSCSCRSRARSWSSRPPPRAMCASSSWPTSRPRLKSRRSSRHKLRSRTS